MASRELELSELCSAPMLIIEKINGVMTTNVMGNNQEWCSDHLLEIMNEILHQAADLKQAQADSALP